MLKNKKVLENKNIKGILYKGRFHNVYQTRESEEYLNKVFGKITELTKKYKGKELEEKTEPIYKNIDYEKLLRKIKK